MVIVRKEMKSAKQLAILKGKGGITLANARVNDDIFANTSVKTSKGKKRVLIYIGADIHISTK